jgi:PAS domain S-box-containing protein
MRNIDRHIDLESPPDPDSRDPVILLLIQNSQDRRLFKHSLPDDFTVVTGEKGLETQKFDLCIVDDKNSRLYREALESFKKQASPAFLPVLLLSQNQDKVQKNPSVLEFADDVVYIPTSSKLLQSRINILLRQRKYSLELEEKNRELERKNKQLAEEKRKYKLITDNATDMISRQTPDGTYRYVSPASKELTGYSPEELVGTNAFETMHPSDREVIKQIEDPFSNEDVVRYSFRKKIKDGSYKWVETTMRRILDDETGELIEFQASTRDISARKEYEQKLTEEKEFIDKAIQSLPEIFYMIDEDRNFVKWTNIKRELGYSDEEVQEMHPLDFYREEDHQFIISKIADAFETGSAEAEVQMEAKSGELIPYFITTKKFKRGDESFLVGSCINLTDIKEAQFELEQHRQLLNAIINQSKSLIYVKDQDKKYSLVNDNYLKVFDLDRDDIIGKTVREVHGKEFAKQVLKNDDAVLKQGKTVEGEESIPVKGQYRFYHSIKYPLRGVPGFENCMCGISTDITDLKLASSQLRKRIKEQQCLYNISSLPEQANTVEELLEKAVAYLPKGWQFPEITEAAITFDGNVYKTEDYRETEWKLSVESNRLEVKSLKVDVVYTEEKEIFEQGIFLKEEWQLIDSVVETLSSQIERMYAQDKLKESEKRWGDLVKNDPNLIQILEPDGTIQFINEAGAKMLGYGTPDKAKGKNYFDLVELEDGRADLSSKRLQKVLEGDKVNSQTYKIRDLNGDILYLESQAVPTTLDDGRRGIQQVAKDVTDREQYERKLKESLKEKETLLQEIHHRVKNNLAVVSGMMELQTFNTKNEEVRSLMADSKNRIKTMALIHEKLYQSESLSQIEFGTYVKDLLENISKVSSVSDKVELDLEYDSFNLNVNQAVPCALVINEIVSNAYEHAFVDHNEGRIDVSLQKREDDTVFVQVKDNGCGLPDNFMDKKDDSIGFTIIGTLIKQLQAETNIESEDGLEFSFSFKKQEIKGSSSTLIENDS